MAKKKYLTAKTYKTISKAKKEKVVFEEKESKKQASSKSKFPSINRFIPEALRKLTITQRVLLSLAGVIAIILFIGLIFFARTAAIYTSLLSQRQTLEKQQAYWQTIVKTYPDYADGYMMLSVLDYKLGEKEDARLMLEKALELNPNSKKALELKETIGEK